MLTMLSTVVVVGASLILPLLCSVLVLPRPDDPAREHIDRQLNGEAISEITGR
jgi:hypothetical protein